MADTATSLEAFIRNRVDSTLMSAESVRSFREGLPDGDQFNDPEEFAQELILQNKLHSELDKTGGIAGGLKQRNNDPSRLATALLGKFQTDQRIVDTRLVRPHGLDQVVKAGFVAKFQDGKVSLLVRFASRTDPTEQFSKYPSTVHAFEFVFNLR